MSRNVVLMVIGMTFLILKWQIPLRVSAVLVVGLTAILAIPYPEAAARTPLDMLIGSWRGYGKMQLADGRQERLICNMYYTGGGSQLGMVIRCSGGSNRIEIRSKLTYSAGRLRGNWEERTYNAEGTVSGSATGSRIKLSITGGGLSGTMSVSYDSARQDVDIETDGIALKSVNITLGRQR